MRTGSSAFLTISLFLAAPAAWPEEAAAPGEGEAAAEEEAPAEAEGEAAAPGTQLLCDFESPEDLKDVSVSPRTHGALTPWHATRGERAIKLTYPARVELSSGAGRIPRDWSGFTHLRFDVFNPQANGLSFEVAIQGSTPYKETAAVGPATSRTIEVDLSKLTGPTRAGVGSVAIILGARTRPHVLFLDNLRLASGEEPVSAKPPEPPAPDPAREPAPPPVDGPPAEEKPPEEPKEPPAPPPKEPPPPPPPVKEPPPSTEPTLPGLEGNSGTPKPPSPGPAVVAVHSGEPKAVLADFEEDADVARFQGEGHRIAASDRGATHGNRSAEVELSGRGAYLELRAGGPFPASWTGVTLFAMDVQSDEVETRPLEIQFMKSVEPPVPVKYKTTLSPGTPVTIRVPVTLLQGKIDLEGVPGIRIVAPGEPVKMVIDNLRLE